MIFVVLGTQKIQFNRLLQMLDELIAEGYIQEKVFAQKGYSDYIPKNFEYVSFMDKDDFEEQIHTCSLMVCHSGVGSITTGLHYGKKIIVVPRLKKFKEHVDDHQVQIALTFEKKGHILVAYTKESLLEKIRLAPSFTPKPYISSTHEVEKLLIEFIEGKLNGKR